MDRLTLRYLLRGFKYRFLPKGFSESGEDLIANYLLGEGIGKYIDIGSGHPVVGSNTFHFYNKNWSGIAVDANPRFELAWKVLRPRDKFLAVSVGSKSGVIEFFEYENDLRSTSNTQLRDYYESQKISSSKRLINQLTLTEIFSEHIGPAEKTFLSIDVEGSELDVLKSLDFTKYQPTLIAVESWKVPWIEDSTLHNFLKGRDYSLVAYSGLTSFYLKLDWFEEIQRARPNLEL